MKNNKKKWRSGVAIFLVVTIVITFASVSALAVFAALNIDSDADELMFSLAKGSSVNSYYTDSSHGCRELPEYEPELLCERSYGEYEKSWYPIEEISDYLKRAYICTEDRSFYSHRGVDVKRTLYALCNTVFKRKARFGASTITQQVIKNISGDNDITFKRKLTEIIRATRLERGHTKDEIFEVYMNIVPMGEGALGVGVGAQKYFGKTPSELSLAEAATLVAVTNAPTKYNPHTNPESCREKRDIILYGMYDGGYITEEEYTEAKNTDISVTELGENREKIDSWFIETVNEDVIAALSESMSISENAARAYFASGGLSIYTTQSPEIQGVLERYFENPDNFPTQINSGLDFSMVISDSTSGALLGIVGAVGEKCGNRLLNLATSPHTPGSSLKPLALYAPLINEKRINAATVFDDVPVNFIRKGSYIGEYPKNYPNIYSGLTTVSDALRLSKNTVAVRLYDMLGAEKIYSSLKNDFGFDTLVRHGIGADGGTVTDLAVSPLALGQLSYGVSLRQLTEAYTVFPAEGEFTRGRSFIAVYDSDGNLIIDNAPKTSRIFRKECAQIMNTLLSGVVERGTASKITLKRTVDTAGKTGTSGSDRDRLFIGYTPYVTAGIWCGYRDGVSAVSSIRPTHLQIWDEVMSEVHSILLGGVRDENIKSFKTDTLVKKSFCKDSGNLFSDSCALDPRGSRIASAYFEPSNIPTENCERHIVLYYDKLTGAIATSACPHDCLQKIALIRIEDRSFPKEIIVADAEYVYRKIEKGTPLPERYDIPYFQNILAYGEYVGRGSRKKQYNSACYLHD